MGKKGYRKIFVKPSIIDSDCKVKVYIDDELVESNGDYLYCIDVESPFDGSKKVRIECLDGYFCLDSKDAIARYVAMVNKETKYIDMHQEDYIDNWYDGNRKFPMSVTAGMTLEYNHIIPYGPSHFTVHYDY